jgi:hypothetical protein
MEKIDLYIVSECLHADDESNPKVLGRFKTEKAAERCSQKHPGSSTIDMYFQGEWKSSRSRLRAKETE